MGIVMTVIFLTSACIVIVEGIIKRMVENGSFKNIAQLVININSIIIKEALK